MRCFFCGSFVIFLSCVFYAFARVCWSPAWKGLTYCLSFVMSNWAFVTFQCGILGQVWYLIVSIPDICPLSYFECMYYTSIGLKSLKNHTFKHLWFWARKYAHFIVCLFLNLGDIKSCSSVLKWIKFEKRFLTSGPVYVAWHTIKEPIAYLTLLYTTEIATQDRHLLHLSRDMRFPTMWYVRPAKPQISLRISMQSDQSFC